MSSGVRLAIPWARTVHGVFPSFAATSAPSPAPKTTSPSASTASVPGRARHIVPFALHRSVGTRGDGRSARSTVSVLELSKSRRRRRHWTSDDATVVGRAAHALESNPATFGATSHEALTRDLETRVRVQDLANTDQLAASITAEWE